MHTAGAALTLRLEDCKAWHARAALGAAHFTLALLFTAAALVPACVLAASNKAWYCRWGAARG